MDTKRKLPIRGFVRHPLMERGYFVPPPITQESFDDALRYQPMADDIFICTFPKCGTTWLSYALLLMREEGVPIDPGQLLREKIPFLDLIGKNATEQAKERPRFIKTHLLYKLVPKSQHAKYIFIARNPKDCLVSFYFHSVGFIDNHWADGKLEDFFEMFMDGCCEFGDYFECVAEWYEKSKTEKNILFLLFEDMTQDFEREFLKVTNFLGDRWTEKVLADGGKLMKKIAEHSNFSAMKKASTSLQPKARRPEDEVVPFIRKGVVANWKEHLTEEQSRRIDEKMKEVASKFRGFDTIWEGHCCL